MNREKIRSEQAVRRRRSESGGNAVAAEGNAIPARNAGGDAGRDADTAGRETATIDRRGRVVCGTAWALVTGAGTGIGRCFALRLAALGYNLILAGQHREPLETVAKEVFAAANSDTQRNPENNRAGALPEPCSEKGGASAEAASCGESGRPESDSDRSDANGSPASRRESGGASGAARCEQTGTSAERSSEERNTFLPGPHPAVRILPIDLARQEASDELYAAVRKTGIEIDVLINNAGIFSFRDVLSTPAERIERMILLHDMTLTKNCLAFGRDMAARGRGWILNMSSFSIWMPFPGMALYTATKAYVRAFSVAFAKEMRERCVRVTAVCPAGVATDLYGLTPRWQRIGLRLGVLISADCCARRGLRAMWRGRRTIVPDWWNRAWIPLCKLLPMCLIRPLRRFTFKFQK